MIDTSEFKYEVIENDGQKGVFKIGPLPRGYGHTMANSLRRVLLSSLPGGGVTSIKIAGVEHEYSTMEGIKENVIEIELNIKKIRFRCESDETQVVRVSKKGEGEIKAGDLELTESVRIMNPDVTIATITDDDATFDMEMNVEKGVGYRVGDEDVRSEVGRMPMDADFSPVERVTFRVDETRKGEFMNLDSITLTVFTDGSIDPNDAVVRSAEILREMLQNLVVRAQSGGDVEEKEESETDKTKDKEAEVEDVEEEVKDWKIEDLPISGRTKNVLMDEGFSKVKDLTDKTAEELLDVSGFGQKSLDEVKDFLSEYDINLE